MACDLMISDDGVMRVRISDYMRLVDLKALQALARESIRRSQPVRVLAILDDFRGWERSPEWEDMGFLAEHGADIVKMAIVGDERWKEEVFLFTGKGFRTTAIEFFPPSLREEAERWLRT